MENRMSANGGSQPKADPLSASGMKPLAGAINSGEKSKEELFKIIYKPFILLAFCDKISRIKIKCSWKKIEI